MKLLFCTMVMITFAGCVEPAVSTADEPKVSTVEQGLSLCSSTCDPPTYNGVAVGCSSNSYCISAPEAAYCLQDDGSWYTAACATPPPCGDGICSSGEDHWSCPEDCGACPAGTADCCGDGTICIRPALCWKFSCN